MPEGKVREEGTLKREVPQEGLSEASFGVGDRVRVRLGVEPKYGWGSARQGDVGTVAALAGDDCRVNFPGHAGWHGFAPEIEVAEAAALVPGAQVRVRAGVATPKFNWGRVRKGELGFVTSVEGEQCRVDFRSQSNWLGYVPELEAVQVEVGMRVRVRASVQEPRHKWGSVTPSMVGVLASLESDGDCKVDFAKQHGWSGYAPELELVDLTVGDHVMVRSEVKEPKLKWGTVHAGEVGSLMEINAGTCKVAFPSCASWTGYLPEMVRVEALPGWRVRVRADVKTPIFNWGQVEPGDVGVLLSVDRDGGCKVDFASQQGWSGCITEMVLVPFMAGDTVRVKAVSPAFGWGCVKPGDVGAVTVVEEGGRCLVDFPAQAGWRGLISDMELASQPHAESAPLGDVVAQQDAEWADKGFVPGAIVRVQVDVGTPKYGWGSVSPGDTGRIRTVMGNTAKVEFQALASPWTAHLPEMELVEVEIVELEAGEVPAADPDPLALFFDGLSEKELDGVDLPADQWLRPGRGEGLHDLVVGQMVRVRPGTTPKHGWGNVGPSDVGMVKQANGSSCQVAFPNAKAWNGWIPDLEPTNGGAGRDVQLFGEISPQDLVQGRLGDCWLIAAIASLAEFPDAVRLIFEEKEWSASGRYTLKLFSLDSKSWKSIVVDDRLPTKNGDCLFAALGPQGYLWAAVLEKAIAVLCGGYKNLVGGWGPTAWAMMTGCENAYTMKKNKENGAWKRRRMVWETFEKSYLQYARWEDGTPGNNEKSAEHLLAEMERWDKMNFLMSASAHIQDSDSHEVEGIVQSHEYSLITVVHNVAGSGHSLVQLRNPWGRKEWGGRWSDGHALWSENPAVKQALQPEFGDDGLFWMCEEDFFRIYDAVCVLEREMPARSISAQQRWGPASGGQAQGPTSEPRSTAA